VANLLGRVRPLLRPGRPGEPHQPGDRRPHHRHVGGRPRSTLTAGI